MKYIIDTLGCKVNQYETQAIETLLRKRGHEPAESGELADFVIVNTCAVTAVSGRKSRHAVRRLMERNPGALSVVCGCWSQIDSESAAEMGADIVRGSGDRQGLVDDIERALTDRQRLIGVDKPFTRRVFEELPAGSYEDHARAYLKIEDGCENFCSYCVIPYARGRVRSLPLESAKKQARLLVEDGFRELVITGIEIAAYGSDLPGKPDLASVVEAMAEAAPELRIRLGSLEPTVVTEDFCSRLAATGKVCDHFHLSLQSGCDDTLKRMNRKYDTAEFFAVTERLRHYFPGCGLTADLITGFPGETQEHHAATLSFIEKCAFSSMHIFPYSRRPGTPADKLPDQNTAAVKSQRASEAHELAKKMKQEYLNSCIGRVLPVIFEWSKDGMSIGHASNYVQVYVPGEHPKRLVENVQISGLSGEMLVGLVVDEAGL